MARMVQCAKLGRELPGLEKPPFAGELGQRIYDNISQEAWDMWQEQSRLIINHYGLNLADPDSRQVLRDQMIEFLFASQNQMPEGWVPEGQSGKGGAPAGKGGAPQRKK
jgi:Fe-S cluster biosynthesis and repair protein YggX